MAFVICVIVALVVGLCVRENKKLNAYKKNQTNNKTVVQPQKPANQVVDKKVVVAIKCEHCGASFKGVAGKVNQCPYCSSYINL